MGRQLGQITATLGPKITYRDSAWSFVICGGHLELIGAGRTGLAFRHLTGDLYRVVELSRKATI